jgi:pimeloyl-ACP methyl ester carboxylesterase
MRGYGDSDKPEGVEAYQIDNLTDDIKQLVLALGEIHVQKSCLKSTAGAKLSTMT